MADIFLVLSDRTLRFPSTRINRLSEICADVALVSLGTVVLPAVLDKLNLFLVLLGSLVCIGFWGTSLFLAEK